MLSNHTSTFSLNLERDIMSRDSLKMQKGKRRTCG